jgi:hypothetical protein
VKPSAASASTIIATSDRAIELAGFASLADDDDGLAVQAFDAMPAAALRRSWLRCSM